MGHHETSLGEDIEGGLPGYGRTFDEAVQDAYQRTGAGKTDPGWYTIAATMVYIENPIREYKVIITPGGGG